MKKFKSKVDEILDSKTTRKKFLQALGFGALTIPLMSPTVAAQFFIRQTDGNLINIDDIGTATGPEGAVQYNNSGQLAGTSNLHWDNTETRLGIGTDTPAATLDVSGNMILASGAAVNKFSVDGTLAENSDTNVPTEQAVKTYVDTEIGSIGGGPSGSGSAGQITYWTGSDSQSGSNNLYWDTTNNRLGIGTNTPAASIELVGQAEHADDLMRLRINSLTSEGNFFSLFSNTNERRFRMYVEEHPSISGEHNIVLRAHRGGGTGDGRNYFVFNPQDDEFYFMGGNVGIGTTTPSTALDVSGTITATGGNSTNWNDAYGWGDHSTAGYLTSISAGTNISVSGNEVSVVNSPTFSGSIQTTNEGGWQLGGNQYTNYNSVFRIQSGRATWYLDQNQAASGWGLRTHNDGAGYDWALQIDHNGRITTQADGTSNQWNTAYTERGSQIAGDGLTWSSNNLNVAGVTHGMTSFANQNLTTSSNVLFNHLNIDRAQSNADIITFRGRDDGGLTTNTAAIVPGTAITASAGRYDLGIHITTGANPRDFWIKATAGTVRIRTDQIRTEGNIVAEGTVTTSTPTANSHAATKAYVDTIQSQAMGTVVHGTSAGTSRPAGFDVITWIGSVEPSNANNNDIWIDTS